MKPIIVINLKTYQQGKEVIKLAKIIEKVDRNIIVGVQTSDIKEISDKTRLKVYAQHVDYMEPGRETGFVITESVKADGAAGTFLNHSEHPLKIDAIKKTIERCKKLKLKTMVFVGNLNEARKIEKLRPDYIIYEPPELVGGKISVSEAKPNIISEIVKKIKIPILVGAGIKKREDVQTAMKLGAFGIGVSSAITKSKNPGRVLRELLS